MTIYRLAPWTLAVLVWSLVGPVAWGQPDSRRPAGGGGRGTSLVELAAGQVSVQEELKLEKSEVGRLKKLSEESRREWQELQKSDLSNDELRKKRVELSEATEKKLADIINPDQLKRLKQIYLQVLATELGPPAPAFRNPRLVAPLELTDEQKEKIATVIRETEDSMKGLAGLAAGGNPDGALQQYLKLRELAQDRIVAVLTSQQQAKWKEMLGEPFKGEIVQAVEFGGRGQGGGNQN